MTSSKNTKRAFLASALSVVLCTAMFVGSTFAWFTDSATTGMNKIQAGNLKIALEKKASTGEWVDVGKDPLAFVQLDDSDKDILWEPGCTYKLPELRVANEGNLAFKFKLLVNGLSGTENAEAEIADLAEVIDVYTGTTKADVVEEKKLGTLRELMGDPDGAAYGVILPEGATVPEGADKTVVAGATAGYNLLFHMQEGAGNKYQNMNLDGVSFTVFATQYTYEKDSFDDQYDAQADYPVADNAELIDKIESAQPGDIVVLPTGSFELPAVVKEGVTISGNGNDTVVKVPTDNKLGLGNTPNGLVLKQENVTVENVTLVGDETIGNSEYNSVVRVDAGGIVLDRVYFPKTTQRNVCAVVIGSGMKAGDVFTISNSTIAAGGFKAIHIVDGCNGTVVIDNCEIDAVYPFNVNSGSSQDAVIKVSNSKLHGWISYGKIASVSFDNTEFSKGESGYDYLKAYTDTTLTDCTFDTDFELGAGVACTITINNCMFDGTKLTADNIADMLDIDDVLKACTIILDGKTVELN